MARNPAIKFLIPLTPALKLKRHRKQITPAMRLLLFIPLLDCLKQR